MPSSTLSPRPWRVVPSYPATEEHSSNNDDECFPASSCPVEVFYGVKDFVEDHMALGTRDAAANS